MTNTAVVALDDGRHGNGIRTFLRQEDGRVADGTSQPFGMWLVRKAHEGHRTGILEGDVEVRGVHVLVAVLALARNDVTVSLHLLPVVDAGLVARKVRHRLHRLLENLHGAVVGIVDAIFRHRHHFTGGLEMETFGPYRARLFFGVYGCGA